MKILLAVDGSDISTRAARFVVTLANNLAQPPQVVLLTADPPMLPGVTAKIGQEAVSRYHAENAGHHIKPARRVLSRAKIDVTEQTLVADPALAILQAARKHKADLIVMGSHGKSAFKGLVLGSVSTKVIAQATVPVTIVR